MSEMIDRVAKPIYAAIKSWQDGVMMDLAEWDEAVADDSAVVGLARTAARAAIEAMREPTAEMQAETWPIAEKEPGEVWRDMIATALK